MKIQHDIDEAVALAHQALNDVLGSVPLPHVGRAESHLRHIVGDFDAHIADSLHYRTFAQRMTYALWAAREAGATFEGIDRVRQGLADAEPKSRVAFFVQQVAIRLCLSTQAVILSRTKFVSRNAVDEMLVKVADIFTSCAETAADLRDVLVYRAITALQYAVIRDLSERARPLPRMVRFSFDERKPALWLAQRIYSDGSRTQEIIDENSGLVHPAFVPKEVRALSK